MQPIASQYRWNNSRIDGDLMTDEAGNVVHVRHKTQAVTAAQKAERVNLNQRNTMLRAVRSARAGDHAECQAMLEAYLSGVFGKHYEAMLEGAE